MFGQVPFSSVEHADFFSFLHAQTSVPRRISLPHEHHVAGQLALQGSARLGNSADDEPGAVPRTLGRQTLQGLPRSGSIQNCQADVLYLTKVEPSHRSKEN